MNRSLFSLFLIIATSVCAQELPESAPAKTINCPPFEPALARQLEPNKYYFNDTVRVRVEHETANHEQLAEFARQFAIDERPLKFSKNEIMAKEIGAPVVYTMQYYRDKYFGRPDHLTTHHVPAQVAYETPFGFLAGESRGEFGGELVFISSSGDVELIADMNLEDIYQFEFGYVITEGLSHMQSDKGTLWLVTFKDGKPKLTELFGLLGAPRSSVKLSNGELLINSKTGSQLLTKSGSLQRVRCSNSN